MRRRLFNVMVLVSALLFVATVSLWARNYSRSDWLWYEFLDPDIHPGLMEAVLPPSCDLVSNGGSLHFFRVSNSRFVKGFWFREFYTLPAESGDGIWRAFFVWPKKTFLGFGFARSGRTQDGHRLDELGIAVPYWSISALMLILLALWIIRRRAARFALHRPGFSPVCDPPPRPPPPPKKTNL